MEKLERIKALTGILAVVVIPLLLGIIANSYSKSLKERELEGKFVELAVRILSDSPSEDNRSIREWATRIINKYSGVPLGDTATQSLIEKTPIAAKASMSNWSPENKAHTTTWVSLLSLDLLPDGTFLESGAKKISNLKIPDETIAKSVAIQLDHIFRELRGAKFEEGMDEPIVRKKISALLMNKKLTVAELADDFDRLYKFWRENE